MSFFAPPVSPPPFIVPYENALLSLPLPTPGMSTYESRGNEIIVALRPSAAMCSTIIVSVLVAPPSDWVLSSAICSGVALSGRWSSPTSRMFIARPSTSSFAGGALPMASTFVTLLARRLYAYAAYPPLSSTAIVRTPASAGKTTPQWRLRRPWRGGTARSARRGLVSSGAFVTGRTITVERADDMDSAWTSCTHRAGRPGAGRAHRLPSTHARPVLSVACS